MNLFRGSTLCEQMRTLKHLLDVYDMDLITEKSVLDVVDNVVCGIEGKALVTFIVGGKIGHAEAIEDGLPMDPRGSQLYKYCLLKTNITVHRIVYKNDSSESSVEVEKISLD